MSKDIQNYILQAEKKAVFLGVAVYQIYEEMYSITKIKELKEIAEKLKAGKKRSEVYKKYLEKDIINFIKILENLNLDIGYYLTEFSDLFKRIKEFRSKIKISIIKEVILYAIFVLFGYALLNKFASIAQENIERFKELMLTNNLLTIKKVYVFLTSLVLIFYILFWLVLKEKINPIYKRVEKYLKALKILKILEIGLSIGLNASLIYELIKKDVKIEKKIISLDDIINSLKNFLSVDAIAIINISLKISLNEFLKTVKELSKEYEMQEETVKKLFFSFLSNAFLVGKFLIIFLVVISYMMFLMMNMKIQQSLTGM